MRDELEMHDVVALLEDIPAKHFISRKDLVLRRGQVGTVVMTFDGSAFEVEFADLDGRAYSMVTVPASKLIALRYKPELSAA